MDQKPSSFNDFPQPLTAIAPRLAPETSSAPKRRRSQASLSDCCRTCRLRKVKCTGKPVDGGKCAICARLELDCSFVVPVEGPIDVGSARTTPSRSHTEAGTVRKRAQRACTNCHSHKTKCSGDQPRCKRCEANNMKCEYVAAKRKFTSAPVNSSVSNTLKAESPSTEEPSSRTVDDRVPENAGVDGPADPGSPEQSSEALHTRFMELVSLESEDLLRRRDFIRLHVDAYFQNAYYLPCLSFYHRESLYREIEEGTLSPTHVAAICSVSAFFVSSHANAIEFAMTCSRQVEFQLFRNVGSLNESNLSLYALDIVHNLFVGKYAKCWQMVAVACRVMLGLQLNWDVPGSRKTFIKQECSRRLAWHMFHMDRICAGGFDAYVCFNEENMKLRLPCNEESFQANQPVSAERLTEKNPKPISPPMSRQGYTIRLINLRHHVQSVAKRFSGGTAYVHGVKWEASRVMEEVTRLQNEVSSFTASLPEDLKLNEQNLARWAGSPEEQIFVFVHSWICILHVELYQFSVPGLGETGSPELLRKLPNTFTVKAQKQAVAFSVAAARFWKMFQEQAMTNRHPLAPLYLGDNYLMPCIQECANVLIAAFHHKLFNDLAEHSSAPLSRTESVTADTIRELITSTVMFIQPLATIIPSMNTQFEELCKHVEEFEKTAGPKPVPTPKITPPQPRSSEEPMQAPFSAPMKLPGPGFMLDTTNAGNTYSVPVRADTVARQVSDANLMPPGWFGIPAASPADPHDMFADLVGFDAEFESEFCPPGMPMLLAEARGLPTYSMWPFALPTTQSGIDSSPYLVAGPGSSSSGPDGSMSMLGMSTMGDAGLYGGQTGSQQQQTQHTQQHQLGHPQVGQQIQSQFVLQQSQQPQQHPVIFGQGYNPGMGFNGP